MKRLDMAYAQWNVRGLLALIFLFTGGTKPVLPPEAMTEQMPLLLSALFLRSIGAAEVLGATRPILPGLLGLQPVLTPLAATGLVTIMIGATVLTLAGEDAAPALVPLVVGLLSTLVAYGRRRPTLHREPAGAHEAGYGHRPLSVGPVTGGNECW